MAPDDGNPKNAPELAGILRRPASSSTSRLPTGGMMAVGSAPQPVVERSSVDLTLAATPNAPPTAAPAPAAAAPAAAPPSARAPSSGAFSLPGYEVIRFFGQGGMGEVFLADRLSETGVSVRCVVKTIREGVGDRAQFENLFLDEARIVSQLRHPNIVSVLDVGRANGRLYLAMEWIEGLDAGELTRRAAGHGSDIPLSHALFILRDTLQGLHYAHSARGTDGQALGLIHRDISPGNILISRHGAVKLADFGVAVAKTAVTAGTAETLAGKPHYFAPELWRRARATPATDIFALGVTFFELLTARPMFPRDKDIPALAFQICEFRVDDLLDQMLSLPDGLEHILRRALHHDVQERYASAMEFLEDVNDYAFEQGIRLLDAHFGDYVARMLQDPTQDARKKLWKG